MSGRQGPASADPGVPSPILGIAQPSPRGHGVGLDPPSAAGLPLNAQGGFWRCTCT